MDATRRTVAGILAVTTILVIAFALGRCTAPTAALEPPAIEPVDIVQRPTPDIQYVDATLDAALTWIASLRPVSAPVVTVPPASTSEADFMACVRQRESHGDYTAIDATGTFRGAYQFYQQGWDAFAPDAWIGVPPDQAPADIQDEVAHAAYQQLGKAPWGGAC